MYIDKLYNRLFSENNIDGLNTLMNEIRVFAMDPSSRAQQLINIINQKKQSGEDFSKEMAELQGLNAPKQSGLDISKAAQGITNTISTLNNNLFNISRIGQSLQGIGNLFK